MIKLPVEFTYKETSDTYLDSILVVIVIVVGIWGHIRVGASKVLLENF
ncbi:hypothetical protein [Abyssisolibacter fermentans]|nr:hypothetical protein [Abyssisolibacter fermentans]